MCLIAGLIIKMEKRTNDYCIYMTFDWEGKVDKICPNERGANGYCDLHRKNELKVSSRQLCLGWYIQIDKLDPLKGRYVKCQCEAKHQGCCDRCADLPHNQQLMERCCKNMITCYLGGVVRCSRIAASGDYCLHCIYNYPGIKYTSPIYLDDQPLITNYFKSDKLVKPIEPPQEHSLVETMTDPLSNMSLEDNWEPFQSKEPDDPMIIVTSEPSEVVQNTSNLITATPANSPVQSGSPGDTPRDTPNSWSNSFWGKFGASNWFTHR